VIKSRKMGWAGRAACIVQERRQGKKSEQKTKREEKIKKRRREMGSYSDYSVKTRGKYTICMFEIGG